MWYAIWSKNIHKNILAQNRQENENIEPQPEKQYSYNKESVLT